MHPTIDTLISVFTLFATVELGVFALVGSLIIFMGIAQRERGEKILEKVELLGDRIEARAKEIEAIFNQAQSMVTKLTDETQSLLKMVSDAQNITERLDIKDKKFTALMSDVEQRANTFSNSNTSQLTTSLLKSPAIASNVVVTGSQPVTFPQPSYPQFYPAIYANPSYQPTGMLNPSLVTTGRNVFGSLQVEQGKKKLSP
jgi:uncharacterized membrane-anchored protein YhcB (DUF1043 family)